MWNPVTANWWTKFSAGETGPGDENHTITDESPVLSGPGESDGSDKNEPTGVAFEFCIRVRISFQIADRESEHVWKHTQAKDQADQT